MSGTEYGHIDTIYKRDEQGHIVLGDFSTRELEYLQDNLWSFTEKVDGTNIRIMWGDSRLVSPALGQPPVPARCEYGGKTDNAQIPTPLLSRLRELFEPLDRAKLESRLPKIGTAPVVLYGEGYGAKIQKAGGNYNPNGCDFVLFDVRVGSWFLRRPDVEDVASTLGLRVVPEVGRGTLAEACRIVADGLTSQWGNFMAEGLVLRPVVELFDRKGQRIITKIKHRDFAQLEKAKARETVNV